jgi:uncharacterized membrane protein
MEALAALVVVLPLQLTIPLAVVVADLVDQMALVELVVEVWLMQILLEPHLTAPLVVVVVDLAEELREQTHLVE